MQMSLFFVIFLEILKSWEDIRLAFIYTYLACINI